MLEEKCVETHYGHIQRVTSADIYIKCVTSPVLERHLQPNGIIELHVEEGEINYFHILELAARGINDSEHVISYIKEQRILTKQKSDIDSNNCSTTSRRRGRSRSSTSKKRQEAAQQTDIELKQSKLLLEDRAHRAPRSQSILKTSKDKKEEHLDYVMEEYKKDLGEEYILLINMIDLDNDEHQPRPRPELQQQTTLPPAWLQVLFAQQLTSWQTCFSGINRDNYNLGHHHQHILEERQEKEERTYQEGE